MDEELKRILCGLYPKLDSVIAGLGGIVNRLEKRRAARYWRYGSLTTAPAALATIASFSGFPHLYGLQITAEEANSFEVTWTSGRVSKTLLFSLSASGTIVIACGENDLPWTEGNPIDDVITVKNTNLATAGKRYQASLLLGVN